MSREYGIHPWEMQDLAQREFTAIVDDLKAQQEAASGRR